MEHLLDPEGNNPLPLLEAFGLTGLEASVYCRLLEAGELNGYEAAKDLGMSRSNAYTALAGLVDKGAAWMREGSPTRYVPLAPGEFLGNRMARLGEIRSRLEAVLPVRRAEPGSHVTIKGATNIRDRMGHLLESCRSRVYLALDPDLLERFRPALEGLLDRGCRVVLIADPAGVPLLEGREVWQKAEVHSGPVPAGQVRIIVDSLHVMSGSLEGGNSATCLHSDQKDLVELFKQAMRNEITLARMGQSSPGEE